MRTKAKKEVDTEKLNELVKKIEDYYNRLNVFPTNKIISTPEFKDLYTYAKKVYGSYSAFLQEYDLLDLYTKSKDPKNNNLLIELANQLEKEPLFYNELEKEYTIEAGLIQRFYFNNKGGYTQYLKDFGVDKPYNKKYGMSISKAWETKLGSNFLIDELQELADQLAKENNGLLPELLSLNPIGKKIQGKIYYMRLKGLIEKEKTTKMVLSSMGYKFDNKIYIDRIVKDIEGIIKKDKGKLLKSSFKKIRANVKSNAKKAGYDDYFHLIRELGYTFYTNQYEITEKKKKRAKAILAKIKSEDETIPTKFFSTKEGYVIRHIANSFDMDLYEFVNQLGYKLQKRHRTPKYDNHDLYISLTNMLEKLDIEGNHIIAVTDFSPIKYKFRRYCKQLNRSIEQVLKELNYEVK